MRQTLLLAMFSVGLLAGCLPAQEARAQVFRAADYGVVADPAVNNAPAIQRAADAAVWGRKPGRIATVEFPCGVIGYEGVITVRPDSLRFQGCGGTVLTQDVTRPGSPTGGGEVYYPVRRVTDVLGPQAPITVLRVRDRAFAGSGRGRGHPATRITLDPQYRLGGARRVHAFWMEDMVLDGNQAATLADLRAIPQSRAKPMLQDSPSYTGLNAGRYRNVDFCLDAPREIPRRQGGTRVRRGTQVGTLITLRRVEISGYAATGILGDTCNRWTLDTVRFGSAIYNHASYKADGGGNVGPDGSPAATRGGAYASWGGWTDVTLSGASWTEVVAQFGLVAQRLVYEDYAVNPMRDNGGGLINVRSGTAAVNCLRVQARWSQEAGSRYDPVFPIQEPERAQGYLWEDGRQPGDCEPPPGKVVLPGDDARGALARPDAEGAPRAASAPAPARRFVRHTGDEVRCLDTQTRRVVPLAVCDRADARAESTGD